MSYIELSHVMFRGELRGATGIAKIKLTANAINAVDTINIGKGQVTYETLFTFGQQTVGSGASLGSVNIYVPDSSALVEIVAFIDNASKFYVDGVEKRHLRETSRAIPGGCMVQLAKGNHTISAVAKTYFGGASVPSSGGFIIVRYMRQTGSSNT